jgi:hypothetical protein
LPALLSSLGQAGLQQAPMYRALPVAQAQVPPQLSDLPPLLPSLGQLGLQQAPL